MLTYMSNFFSGGVDSTWPHIILLSVTVLASFAVAAGIVFESPKYSESIHHVATVLVIGGVTVEAVCTIFLFAFDEGISNAQQSKIIGLELKLLPRSQLLVGHEADIAAKLSMFPNTKFDCSMGANSSEQLDFWRDLEPILIKATWVHLGWNNGHTEPLGAYNSQAVGNQPLCGPATARNVEVDVPPEQAKELGSAAEAIVSALKEVQISAAEAGSPIVSMNKGTIHIQIGEKR